MEQELTGQVADLEERVAVINCRVEQLERNTAVLTRLATAVEVLATRQESMGHSLERLSGKLDTLEQRPVRRWETLVDKILLVLAGCFVTFLLTGGGTG